MTLDTPTLESPPAPPDPRKSWSRTLLEWLGIIVAAVLVSLLVRTYVFQTYYVPSGSMEPTLMVGDHIGVSKLSVTFGTIHRGDIVVFKAPAAVARACGDNYADLVKRVIGLPGDQLTSKGNTIYVNGKALKQPWSHIEPIVTAIGHVTVPANHYFMMGDNEPGSCDSRSWGTVPRSSIIGKAVLRLWPLSRFGFL